MNWAERIAYAAIGLSAVVLHVLVIAAMVGGLWLAVMPHSTLPVQCMQWLQGLFK